MVLTRRFELPNLVAATLAGVVTSRDQAELVSFARAAIQLTGSVRILLRLKQFAGWNPDARFDGEALWLRDDEGVSRIAIVGEPTWRIAVMTLMAQPIRRVPIEYFATETAARCWLGGASQATTPATST